MFQFNDVGNFYKSGGYGKVGGEEDKVKFLVEQMRSWEKHCQTPLPPVSPHFTPFQQGSGGGWVWGGLGV